MAPLGPAWALPGLLQIFKCIPQVGRFINLIFPLREVFFAARRKKVGTTGGSRLSSGETGNIDNVTGRSFRATGKAVQKDKPVFSMTAAGKTARRGRGIGGRKGAGSGWGWSAQQSPFPGLFSWPSPLTGEGSPPCARHSGKRAAPASKDPARPAAVLLRAAPLRLAWRSPGPAKGWGSGGCPPPPDPL